MTAVSRWIQTLNPVGNPLAVRGYRARLRPRSAMGFGLITVTLAAFVYLISYYSATQQVGLTIPQGAAAAVFPLIIVQGVILMLLGTGAVAGGLVRERQNDLLDYHRLTPMSPTAKIIGLMFGLPAREYFLFMLTMPFVMFAAMRGGMDMGRLMQLYLVFFTSVWLYHLTALAAGMVVNKPWRAATMSQGLVILLYFVLPNFSNLGLTFFEFLTARPTFYAMVLEELYATGAWQGGAIEAATAIARYKEVAFFNLTLHPTLFTLLVQAFAIVTLFTVALRKWVSESAHPFTKRFAVLFYAGLQVFLLGSLWPVVTDELRLKALTRAPEFGPNATGARYAGLMICLVMVALSGLLAAWLIYVSSPERATAVKAARRAAKLRQPHPPANSDGATAMPVTLGLIAIATAAWFGLLAAIQWGGLVWATDPPAWWATLLPPAVMGFVLAAVLPTREALGSRPFALVVFLAWVVPVLAALVVAAASDDAVVPAYLSVPSPPSPITFAIVWMFGLGDDINVRDAGLVGHIVPLMLVGLALYIAATAAAIPLWRRWWRSVRAEAVATLKTGSTIRGTADQRR